VKTGQLTCLHDVLRKQEFATLQSRATIPLLSSSLRTVVHRQGYKPNDSYHNHASCCEDKPPEYMCPAAACIALIPIVSG